MMERKLNSTQRAPRPSVKWLAAGDSGVAVLLLTSMLSMVALTIAISHFTQNRSHHFEMMCQRASVYARYASEYAVAVYGMPRFLSNPELADVGQTEDNLIEPVELDNMMANTFMFEDMAHSFQFHFRDLKMDKIFDVSSSRPIYFVSALGKVEWTDSDNVLHSASHRSAVGVSFGDFSRFMYFSNGEVSPEGNQVTFKSGERIYGRVHINGAAAMSSAGNPTFYGLFSQTEPQVINLDSPEYPQVFTGGWMIPYAQIQWPPDGAIDQIKEQRVRNHTYESVADYNGQPHRVTTYLKFDHRNYHVGCYLSDTLGAGGDTIYVENEDGLNWHTKSLPSTSGSELIYVKGVCRLEGIVRGKITVLSSDSMFIMDNIITEDTYLNPCPGEPPAVGTQFGMVPLGSPNRIGLASEGSIIIAATLENGWANGLLTPTLTCGQAYNSAIDSNIGNVCEQGRKDVIITAAIFAVDCSFEAEFWKTTAYNATIPTPVSHTEGCSGMANTKTKVWDNIPGGVRPDCLGASDLNDRRGDVHICGSVVQTHRGFIIRNPTGPWGQAWIGYEYKNYRYDDNYLNGGPPVWFKVTYDNGSVDTATEMVVPDYDRWRKLRQSELNE